MYKRSFLVLITAALMIVVVACTAKQEQATAPDLKSEVKRDTNPEVSSTMIGKLVVDNNRFAFDLFQALHGEGNLFFSPYSISTALAMTYAGARAETADQIANVLRYSLPPVQLHPAFNALALHLMDDDNQEGFELIFANALWGQEEMAFRQEFLDLMATHYDAGMNLVNFHSEDGRRVASERINQWVNEATDQRISDLVEPGIFTELTRLILTNAITFDGLWAYPFEDTTNANFALLDGSTVLVPLMQRRVVTTYAAGENWQAAALSYQGERFHMLILLPAEGQFDEFVQALDAARLADIEAAMSPTELVLYLPRFALAASLALSDPLKNMGMPLAFSESEADFSGIAEIHPGLCISQVLHKAYLEVNETGSKAAAASAVELEVGAESSVPEIMRVDRPFIFLIRDTEQGAILFLGRMENPADPH